MFVASTEKLKFADKKQIFITFFCLLSFQNVESCL